MVIGYIGLGSMGGPIARRLARSGYKVIGYDVSAQAMQDFTEPGTELGSDPLDVARRSDVLGVCVRTDQQLEDLTAEAELFAALGKGGLFILNSTVSPDLARRLAEQAKQHGVDFVDVGVSGGAPAALEGKLSLFIGADEPVFERAKPILATLSPSVTLLGPVGRGQEGKLLNNLISIAGYGLAAAILDLGEQLHFDREQLRQALMAGSGQSFALKVIPNLLAQTAPGSHGFKALHELLSKDVQHASELVPVDDPAMATLLAASQSMLDRIKAEADK